MNAGVVGLLLAALYQPVWTSAVHAPLDFGLAVVALVALMSWRLPPWLVVAVAGGAGWLAGLRDGADAISCIGGTIGVSGLSRT